MGKIIILWVIWRIKLNTRYKVPGEGLTPTTHATNQAFYSFLPTEQAGRQIRIRKLRDAKSLDQGHTAGEQKVCAYCLCLELLSRVTCERAQPIPQQKVEAPHPSLPPASPIRGKKRCLQRGP